MRRRIRWLVPFVAVLGVALVLVAWHLAVALPPHEDDPAVALLERAGNASVYRVSRPTPGAFFGGMGFVPGDVTDVYFYWGPVTHEQLAAVSGLRECESVSFSRTGVPDPGGLELLSNMPHLRWLFFRHDSATDETVTRYLARLPHVQCLFLQDNPLTDACIEALAGLPSLRAVEVHGTRITDEGASRLRRLRPDLEVDTTTPTFD